MSERSERLLRDAERELVDAAIALDDQWKEIGSCETAGERVESFVARVLGCCGRGAGRVGAC